MLARHVLLTLAAGMVLAQVDTNSELWKRAVAAQEHGDLEQAAKLYIELLHAKPLLTSARANLASAQAQLGRWPEAIENFNKVLVQSPANRDARLNLAQAYYNSGDWERATRELERLLAAPPIQAHAVLLLGDCYLRRGRAADAARVLAAQAKQAPEDPDVNYLLGMAQIRAGDHEQGVVLVERVAKTKRSADAYLLAGATRFRMTHFAEALKDLEMAIQINPGIPEAYAWVGQVRDQVADEEGAKAAFAKALEFDPENFEAHLHLGAILIREKDYEAAAPHLERALLAKPNSLLARYAVALLRAGTGRSDDAIKLLEDVTRTAPNWVEPHVKLAAVYFKAHRPDEGRREQAMADKLNADHRNEKPE